MAFKIFVLITISSIFLHYATSHEDEGHHDARPAQEAQADSPPNYFRHPHHAGWIYAHIILMILSWVFILPVMVMLRIARSSRFCGLSQVGFHVTNLVGLLVGWIYHGSTPDLYSCNVHGVMGCIGTLLAVGSSLCYVSAFLLGDGEDGKMGSVGRGGLLERLRGLRKLRRFAQVKSRARYQSLRPGLDDESDEYDNESVESLEKHDPAHRSASTEKWFEESNDRYALTLVSICRIVLDRSLLVVGFAVCVSGFVVYSGNFRGLEVFGGLSHWIKGGIFFWVGLLTMGRWIGAFADLGWAWNVKPCSDRGGTDRSGGRSWKSRVPSLEFVESFLIWTYGASNVFLEHLSNWGGEWSAVDFEHISITVLFFGGGLLGMVVEAEFVQRLINKIELPDPGHDDSMAMKLTESPDKQSRDQSVSLNPMPSLTIGFLGLMMSNHHQHTALGAQIHAQWGYLFFASALSRLATLLTLHHKPPSVRPARPVTELITAFCLTGGGILFMMSGRDSIAGLEANKIVAMTAFTGTMGLSAVVLSWEVVVFGLKGWAGNQA